MARPTPNTKSTRVRVKDTVADSLTQITPVAPIQEQVRSPSAEAAQALADFAGVGATLMGQRQIKREEEGALQAKRDIKEGIMDQKMMETNERYKIERERNRGTVNTAKDLPEIINTVKSNLFGERTLDDVMREYDDMVGVLYSADSDGPEDDIYLNEVARHVERARAQLMQDKQDLDLSTSREEAASDFIGGQYEDAKERGYFDWDVVWAGAHAIFDGRDANALVFGVADRWARDGNPDVWETMPDKFGKQASFKNSLYIQQDMRASESAGQKVIDDARTERIAALSREQVALRVATQTRLHALAGQGVLPMDELWAAVEPDSDTWLQIISTAEAKALINRNVLARQADMMRQSYITDVQQGNAYHIPPKWLEQSFAEAVALHTEEEQLAAGVDYAVRNGHLMQQQKTFMTMAQTGTPNFQPSYEMYLQFGRQKPGFLDDFLDSYVMNNFRVYEGLVEAGHSPEDAEGFIQNQNPALSAAFQNGEIQGFIDDVVSEIADPGLFTWRDLQIGGALRVKTAALMRTYINMNMIPQQAAKLAVTNLEANLVEIDNIYHTKKTWGHGPFAQPAADLYKELVLPEGADPDDWAWYPAGNEDGFAFLTPIEDQLPGTYGRAKYLVKDITDHYREEMYRINNEEVAAGVAAERQSLEDSVMDQVLGSLRADELSENIGMMEWVREGRRETWLSTFTQRERDDMLAHELQVRQLEEESRESIAKARFGPR